MVPGAAPAPFGGEDWGTTRDWTAETTGPVQSKDWAAESSANKDWAAEPPPSEWGADELQPSGDWGTSVTMQDANTGAEWA